MMDNRKVKSIEENEEDPLVYGERNKYLRPMELLAGPFLLVGMIFRFLIFTLLFLPEEIRGQILDYVASKGVHLFSFITQFASSLVFGAIALFSYLFGYTHCQNINKIPDHIDEANRLRSLLDPPIQPVEMADGSFNNNDPNQEVIAGTIIGPCNFLHPSTILWVGIWAAIAGSLLDLTISCLFIMSVSSPIQLYLILGVIAGLATYLVGVPGILYGYAYCRCLKINGIDEETDRFNLAENIEKVKAERAAEKSLPAPDA